MDIENTIQRLFNEILDQQGTAQVSSFSDDLQLMESGLDSLGFAILVAKLDDQLQYDPFTLMDKPVYPQTFGEFVSIYKKFQPEGQTKEKS